MKIQIVKVQLILSYKGMQFVSKLSVIYDIVNVCQR